MKILPIFKHILLHLFFIAFAVHTSASEIKLKDGDKVLFFGDSITQAGAKPGGYVDLISQSIKITNTDSKIEIVGAGISGNKIANLLKRVDRDIIKKEPSHVVIYIGINDVWHWHRLHPTTKQKREGTKIEDYKAGLEELVHLFEKNNIRPILCTPTVIGEKIDPQNKISIQLDEYAQVVRDIAIKREIPLVDLRSTFLNYLTTHNTKGLDKGILTRDTVHLNEKGNRLVADTLLESFIFKP